MFKKIKTGSIIFFILPSILLWLGCKPPDKNIQLTNLGTALFRRSFSGHENWTDSELDSVQRSNPNFVDTIKNALPILLTYLETLAYISKQELIINELDNSLQDTITVLNSDGKKYLIFMDHSFIQLRSLKIKGGSYIDSIKLNMTSEHAGLRLEYLEPNKRPFVVLLNKYYFMNGDMYEVTLFKID